jgi:hypothetical protein
LPLVVGGSRRVAANQCGGADTDDRTRQDAALGILDGSNEVSRHPLRARKVRLQQTCGGEKKCESV